MRTANPALNSKTFTEFAANLSLLSIIHKYTFACPERIYE